MTDFEDDVEFAFELGEPDPHDHSIGLVCHPSRKLTLDEYVEALRTFIEQLAISQVYEEDSRNKLN